MSPSYAGPFRKSARSCHWCYFSCSGTMCSTTGVSALPKSKSHLSANCRGICFVLSSRRICWPLLCRPFLSASRFWVGSICLVSPPLQSRTQVPVSCLRSYCQPFGTPSQGEALHNSGSRLCFFLSPFICFPLSLFTSFHQSLGYLSFYPSFLSSLSCSFSPVILLYSLPFIPHLFVYLSFILTLAFPFLFLFPLLTCSFSFPHISNHLPYPAS